MSYVVISASASRIVSPVRGLGLGPQPIECHVARETSRIVISRAEKWASTTLLVPEESVWVMSAGSANEQFPFPSSVATRLDIVRDGFRLDVHRSRHSSTSAQASAYEHLYDGIVFNDPQKKQASVEHYLPLTLALGRGWSKIATSLNWLKNTGDTGNRRQGAEATGVWRGATPVVLELVFSPKHDWLVLAATMSFVGTRLRPVVSTTVPAPQIDNTSIVQWGHAGGFTDEHGNFLRFDNVIVDSYSPVAIDREIEAISNALVKAPYQVRTSVSDERSKPITMTEYDIGKPSRSFSFEQHDPDRVAAVQMRIPEVANAATPGVMTTGTTRPPGAGSAPAPASASSPRPWWPLALIIAGAGALLTGAVLLVRRRS